MPRGNDLISTCNLQTDINNNSHSVFEALESLPESSSLFRGLQHPFQPYINRPSHKGSYFGATTLAF